MLKIKYEGEIHIFQLKDKQSDIGRVRETVRENFRRCPEYFSFEYLDTDGDTI